MGPHGDKEHILCGLRAIASLSLGDTREFQLINQRQQGTLVFVVALIFFCRKNCCEHMRRGSDSDAWLGPPTGLQTHSAQSECSSSKDPLERRGSVESQLSSSPFGPTVEVVP